MILSKRYAKKLIKGGKAEQVGTLKPDDNGRVYAILNRTDIQRTDHYLTN